MDYSLAKRFTKGTLKKYGLDSFKVACLENSKASFLLKQNKNRPALISVGEKLVYLVKRKIEYSSTKFVMSFIEDAIARSWHKTLYRRKNATSLPTL
jgi:hypothetical protein